MAYGKIKADALIYDNSGSDVEKTIASLAADPEGTAIKSTGESGTTKFLRVDGDGTASWQVPPDTTYSVGDGGLSQNNFTNADHTKLDGIAASANNYAISADLLDEDNMATNSDTKVPSQQSVKAYVDLKAPTADPTFTGTVTCSNLTVNGTTTTINSATLTVDDKNIELGSVSSPSDTTADGGGITLKGTTDKTIIWSNTTDYWTFNKSLEVTTGIAKITGAEGDTARLLMYADEGDDNADKWKLESTTGGEFKINTYSTGSWVTAININSLGDVTGIGTVSDSKGNVRSIPRNAKTSAYTLLATDAGKLVDSTSGGWTVPNSVMSQSDAVTLLNNSAGDLTITQGSGVTIYNSADGSTGNRTLATRGIATLYFMNASVAYISGSGLS